MYCTRAERQKLIRTILDMLHAWRQTHPDDAMAPYLDSITQHFVHVMTNYPVPRHHLDDPAEIFHNIVGFP